MSSPSGEKDSLGREDVFSLLHLLAVDVPGDGGGGQGLVGGAVGLHHVPHLI